MLLIRVDHYISHVSWLEKEKMTVGKLSKAQPKMKSSLLMEQRSSCG